VEDGFPDRSFAIEFWQEQGDEAIFAVAWELVEVIVGGFAVMKLQRAALYKRSRRVGTQFTAKLPACGRSAQEVRCSR